MKIHTIKAARLMVFMALCCALLVSSFLVPQTAAAATKKTAISATTMTIPVGKVDSKTYWNKTDNFYLGHGEKLTVANAVKGAKYQFTSSNTKVVKIGKSGGYLTGLKAGSAIITLTQTYKNKKTTVGKCKVTVKNSSLYVSSYGMEYAIGSGQYDLVSYYSGSEPFYMIFDRNPNATYTLTSGSKDFTIKEVKYDASKVKTMTDDKEYQDVITGFIGKGYFYGYEYAAKAAGTYTVTIQETYNKKTRKLGTFKVVVKDVGIAQPNIEMHIDDGVDVFNLIDFENSDKNYYFKIKDYDEANPDNNVLGLMQEDDTLYLLAMKTGTDEVIITEDTAEGRVIGTVTVTVTEAVCENVSVDEEEYTTYVGDDSFGIYYELEPYDTTDQVTIESDKPDVLKVEYSSESESWVYTPLKAGEANINIKCGSKSATVKVVVEDEEW